MHHLFCSFFEQIFSLLHSRLQSDLTYEHTFINHVSAHKHHHYCFFYFFIHAFQFHPHQLPSFFDLGGQHQSKSGFSKTFEVALLRFGREGDPSEQQSFPNAFSTPTCMTQPHDRRAEQAWRMRWQSIFLLELRGGFEAEGVTPPHSRGGEHLPFRRSGLTMTAILMC